jgi:hypothetical protein
MDSSGIPFRASKWRFDEVGDCTYYKYRTDILIEMETFS